MKRQFLLPALGYTAILAVAICLTEAVQWLTDRANNDVLNRARLVQSNLDLPRGLSSSGPLKNINHGGDIGVKQRFVSAERPESLMLRFDTAMKEQGWTLVEHGKVRWGVYDSRHCQPEWFVTFQAEDRGDGQTIASVGTFKRDGPIVGCPAQSRK
jgi:hypothetical protein